MINLFLQADSFVGLDELRVSAFLAVVVGQEEHLDHVLRARGHLTTLRQWTGVLRGCVL